MGEETKTATYPLMGRLCHNPLFVIASDRRERGNLLFFNKLQIASVAALPRNDIMTQPRGEGRVRGIFNAIFRTNPHELSAHKGE